MTLVSPSPNKLISTVVVKLFFCKCDLIEKYRHLLLRKKYQHLYYQVSTLSKNTFHNVSNYTNYVS
jgi:hypothetical protein